MGMLNVANRTLAVMDNYPFLRSLNNECVDLIAIDPPFAANETFTSNPRPPISQAEYDEEVALAASHGVPHNEGIGETRVQDFWTWDDDVHPAWKMRIQDDHPQVHSVIEAVEACATENEAAYICYMAVRLIECHRILKPTGSIYVHCDDRANSYLRMLLNAVFGADNFQNLVVWKRATAHNDPNRYGRIADSLLFYSKSSTKTFNRVPGPYSEAQMARYKYQDERGPFRAENLTAPHFSPTRTVEWRGAHPGANRQWRYATDELERLYSEGRILLRRDGLPRKDGYKSYLDEAPGAVLQDIWTDIELGPTSRERTGYATQKPLALYERIVESSSNPGDVVLDVFAGCATTAIAAERLGRQWIACDMAYRSWTMLKRRFYQIGIQLEGMSEATSDALGELPLVYKIEAGVIGPNELPRRDDVDPLPSHQLEQSRRTRSTQSSTWSGQIGKEEAKDLLVRQFGAVCWGCGYEPRRPNGSLYTTLLEVDHIRARRAAEGTPRDDELYNLALLHRTCNLIKRNRLTLEELRRYNADNGLLYVNTAAELVDLFEATRFAAQEISRRAMGSGDAVAQRRE